MNLKLYSNGTMRSIYGRLRDGLEREANLKMKIRVKVREYYELGIILAIMLYRSLSRNMAVGLCLLFVIYCNF